MESAGVDALAPGQEVAPKALKEAIEVKGSHRRLVVVLAFILVVAVAGAVLAAQVKAGTGVGFGIVKALADTGGSDAMAVPPSSMSERGMSVGASCAGPEGGSSCGMGTREDKGAREDNSADGATCGMGAREDKGAREDNSADGATCGMAKPEAKADAKAVAANCPEETGEDCSTCDETATCSVYEAAEKAAETDTK